MLPPATARLQGPRSASDDPCTATGSGPGLRCSQDAQNPVHPQRQAHRSLIRARHAPAGSAPGGVRRGVGEERLRARRGVRLLPGHDRRASRPVLSAEARTDGRARHRHARRASQRTRAASLARRSCSKAACSAASASRASWSGRPRSSSTVRAATGRPSARRSTATCAAAPDTDASSTPSRRPARPWRTGERFQGAAPPRLLRRGVRPPPQPGDRHRRWQWTCPERVERHRIGSSPARQGGTGAGARPEAVRRRHARAGHAAWRDGPDAASARAGRENRHRRTPLRCRASSGS